MENKGGATSPPAATQAQVRQQQQQQQQNGNGVIKLPPGFRFHPTDEELVVHYLIRKALSCPLPASFIPEINLTKFNPWDLPAGSKQDKYFFALREAKYPNGNRANRATSLGYWKATGKDRAIVASRCNQVVGMKKVLVFYRKKASNGSRTDWIMHEYRLASQRLNSAHRDWVLCHIFTKKRKTDVEQHQGERAVGFIDFMGTQRSHGSRPSSPLGSDSSCVTEGMDESSNGEDTSSSSPP